MHIKFSLSFCFVSKSKANPIKETFTAIDQITADRKKIVATKKCNSDGDR